MAFAIAWVSGAPSVRAQLGGDASVDAGLRLPSLGPDDWLIGRGATVLPHLESGIGLELDYLNKPLVVTDPMSASERAVVDHRATGSVLYGVGLFDLLQASIIVPVIFQDGAGQSAYNGDPSNTLEPAVVGDLRFDFVGAPTEPVLVQDDVQVRVALASGLTLPTGDEDAFSGGQSLAGYVSAIGRANIGMVELGLDLGARLRETTRLLDRSFGSELVLVPGAAVHLLDGHLTFAAELLTSIGLVADSDPVFAPFVELSSRLLSGGAAQLAVGAGFGLNDGPRSAAYELVFSFRYLPTQAVR